MQVYKNFDIGTDKIPLETRENIPHHLLDVVSPSTQFTAADFARLALETANAILKKKKLPLIVGGTGLYLKALINGLFPGGGSDPQLRQKLEKEAKKNSSYSSNKSDCGNFGHDNCDDFSRFDSQSSHDIEIHRLLSYIERRVAE